MVQSGFGVNILYSIINIVCLCEHSNSRNMFFLSSIWNIFSLSCSFIGTPRTCSLVAIATICVALYCVAALRLRVPWFSVSRRNYVRTLYYKQLNIYIYIYIFIFFWLYIYIYIIFNTINIIKYSITDIVCLSEYSNTRSMFFFRASGTCSPYHVLLFWTPGTLSLDAIAAICVALYCAAALRLRVSWFWVSERNDVQLYIIDNI